MKTPSFFFVALFLAAFSTPSEAQFLKKLSDGLEKVAQELEAGLEDVNNSARVPSQSWPSDLPSDSEDASALDVYCEVITGNVALQEFATKSASVHKWEGWARARAGTGITRVGRLQRFETEDELLTTWVDRQVEKLAGEGGSNQKNRDRVTGILTGIITYCAFKQRETNFRFLYIGGGHYTRSEYEFLQWAERKEKKISEMTEPTRTIDDEGNIVESMGVVKVQDWIGEWSLLGSRLSGLDSRDYPAVAAVLLGGGQVVENVSSLILPSYDEAIAHYEDQNAQLEAAELAAREEQRTRELQRAANEEREAQEREQLKQLLVSGQRTPQNIDEATLRWSAKSGFGIVARPPLDADNAYYKLWGRLDLVNGEDSYIFRQLEADLTNAMYPRTVASARNFFIARSTRNAVIRGEIRVNTDYDLIGQFVGTTERTLTSGETVYVPVFNVVFWDAD